MNLHEKNSSPCTIGVISDTHGLVRPEVIEALRGVDRIVHAGDIGDIRVLDSLRHVAPVTAVKGNMDRGEWTRRLPESEAVEIGNLWLYVIHDIQKMDLDPNAAGFNVVVFGHSHHPFEKREKGVMFINPGSAGPKRFRFPVSLAFLDIINQSVATRFLRFGERI
ncbi:MAG: metallophosphoesterase family protein [Pseudomonadota bacterium]